MVCLVGVSVVVWVCVCVRCFRLVVLVVVLISRWWWDRVIWFM